MMSAAREQRQDGEQPGCKTALSSERGETSGQVRTDHAGKDKDEPEEAEAVESCNGAVRLEAAPLSAGFAGEDHFGIAGPVPEDALRRS